MAIFRCLGLTFWKPLGSFRGIWSLRLKWPMPCPSSTQIGYNFHPWMFHFPTKFGRFWRAICGSVFWETRLKWVDFSEPFCGNLNLENTALQRPVWYCRGQFHRIAISKLPLFIYRPENTTGIKLKRKYFPLIWKPLLEEPQSESGTISKLSHHVWS